VNRQKSTVTVAIDNSAFLDNDGPTTVQLLFHCSTDRRLTLLELDLIYWPPMQQQRVSAALPADRAAQVAYVEDQELRPRRVTVEQVFPASMAAVALSWDYQPGEEYSVLYRQGPLRNTNEVLHTVCGLASITSPVGSLDNTPVKQETVFQTTLPRRDGSRLTAYATQLQAGWNYRFVVLVRRLGPARRAPAQGVDPPPTIELPHVECPAGGCDHTVAIQPSDEFFLPFMSNFEVASGILEAQEGCRDYEATIGNGSTHPGGLCGPYVTYKVPASVPLNTDSVVTVLRDRYRILHPEASASCMSARTKLWCQELFPRCVADSDLRGCSGRLLPCLGTCEAADGLDDCPAMHAHTACEVLHGTADGGGDAGVESKCCITGSLSREACFGDGWKSMENTQQATADDASWNRRANLTCYVSSALAVAPLHRGMWGMALALGLLHIAWHFAW